MKYIVPGILTYLLVGCATGTSAYIPSFDNQGKMGANIRAEIIKPDGRGPFPAVVMMHGCAGLTSATYESLKGHAKYLVANGFVAVIVDSLTARGKAGGRTCVSRFGGDLREERMARYYRKIDAYNALRYLKTLPFIDSRNFFFMGQSQGATVGLKLANPNQYPKVPDDVEFNAIVAFYPQCREFPKKLQTPVLVLGGAKDDWTPMGTCLVAKRWDLGQPYEVIQYDGAYHAFDLYAPVHTYMGHLIGGNPKSRNDSREQMLKWFKQFQK